MHSLPNHSAERRLVFIYSSLTLEFLLSQTCVPSQSAVHGASVGRKSDTYRWIETGIISVSQGGSVFRMSPKQCSLSNFPPKRHVTSWMRNRAQGGQDLSSLGKT